LRIAKIDACVALSRGTGNQELSGSRLRSRLLGERTGIDDKEQEAKHNGPGDRIHY
jgi:hypothetical protein